MKTSRCFFIFTAALIGLLMAACGNLEGGTVIITNYSNKEYIGRVWTDSKELFSGRIRAWNARSFYVSEDVTVYTDFESGSGNKSNPSGSVSGSRTLILDL